MLTAPIRPRPSITSYARPSSPPRTPAAAVDTVELTAQPLLLPPTAASVAAAAVPGSGGVQVWLSTIDQQNLLQRQTDLQWQAPDKSTRTITVNDGVRYQTMQGGGASITDSSAFLLQQRLPPSARADLMRSLFSRDGIHLTVLRQPMSSCDYSLDLHTSQDAPDNFTIDSDKRFILPSLREALSTEPDLKIIASPWSAPGWMKSSGSIIGGHLEPQYYRSYAEYFAKFVEAYRAEGVPIHAVTPQNEPLYVPGHYPGMSLPAADEAEFIKQGLGPVFQERGLDTKILVYDHNWDGLDYPNQVLNDPQASQYVAGVAWHGYGGRHEAMQAVHDAHPDKEVWFTENSGGDWVPAFHDAFMDQTKHVIRCPRNWAKSVVWWNLALDRDHGPSLLGPNSTCRGLVTIDQCSGQVSYNVDYYTMGHLTKFVEPGAVRIDSNTFEDDLENVAFQNPDGSKALIVSNRTAQDKTFQVQEGGRAFSCTLPGEAAATFVWSTDSPP